MAFGVGSTGRVGTWGVPDTLARHAVRLPWPQGAHTDVAVCGTRCTLTWVWGFPLEFSLTDGDLCRECVARLRGHL